MKKVSYEAWAALYVGGGVIMSPLDGRPSVFPTAKLARYYAGFAPLQKVRVTIEPVNKTKQRRLHGTRKRKANSERTKG